MLYAGYSIKKSIDTLMNYKKMINQKTEIIKMQTRLDSELSSMLKFTDELLNIIQYDDCIDRGQLIYLKDSILKGMRELSDIKDFNDTIRIINYYLDFQSIGLQNIDLYDAKPVVRYLSDNSYNAVEELSLNDCVKIMSSININRDFNVFSSRARSGSTLEKIKSLSLDKATIYALEEKDNLFKSCKEVCDRTIKGLLTGSRISNDVFDMMILTPQVSWEYKLNQTGGLVEKAEKAMFRNHIKHLRNNGIFVYTIPISRLTRDMALLISKTLDNVQVIKKEDNLLKQVIIVGTKNQTREPREDIYAFLSKLKYEDVSSVIEIKYNLTSGGIKIPDFFRGSALDEEELLNLIANSGLMNSFWEKSINIEKQSTRPLLPFNMGQIGLVLTSGCLDGIVEEYEGQYHAIKGMVTKIRHNDTTDEGNNEEVNVETISNKVQINIVTPDGNFIELA